MQNIPSSFFRQIKDFQGYGTYQNEYYQLLINGLVRQMPERLCPCSRHRDGFWVLLRAGQLSTAANPAEGPPVTPRIIISDQTASAGDPQHRSAGVHVHRSRRVCEWLILILVDQRNALRVANLNHRCATA